MSRNQNRIEGQYAIVSTYRVERTAQANVARHEGALLGLIDQGAIVEQLIGRWDGTMEQSIRIHGPGAAEFARHVADDSDQMAFIVVEAGVATVWTFAEGLWLAGETYTSLIEDADATDNYSETMSGFRFRFV